MLGHLLIGMLGHLLIEMLGHLLIGMLGHLRLACAACLCGLPVQMSLMEAEGLSETSKDFSINGVNVSVVDKVRSSCSELCDPCIALLNGGNAI